MRPCILIVDDEPNVRLTYRATLETEGLEVREATDAAAALREMGERNFDLAILDMRMPEVDGLELLERMRELKIQQRALQSWRKLMSTDSLLPGRFVAAAMSPPHIPGHEDMRATVFSTNLNMADILYILTSELCQTGH